MTNTPNISPNRSCKTRLMIFGVLCLTTLQAVASPNTTHPSYCSAHNKPFAHTVCQIHPKKHKIQLSLAWKTNDEPILTFHNLLKIKPNTLFAMNAGMYDHHYAPIGYTVIEGKQILSLNLKKGAGNFHLMPNGVFWQDKKGFHISESRQMARLLKRGIQPIFATQSGPMLVINNQIHPKFDPHSTSHKTRNGVGVCSDGMVKFVISNEWVSFYQFAQLFKDNLACPNALFLDGGTASALYSQELQRSSHKKMGVIIVGSPKL